MYINHFVPLYHYIYIYIYVVESLLNTTNQYLK